MDLNTGEIVGFEKFFEILAVQDKQRLSQNMQEGAKNLLDKIKPGEFMLSKISEINFMLEHQDGTKHDIMVVT